MKNIRFTAVFLALLMMTGCSEDKNSGEAPAQEFTSQTEYVMQDGDTQITGEVTSIVGNEVTLALGDVIKNERGNRGEKPVDSEMPEIPEGGFDSGEMPEIPDGGFDSGEMSEIPKGGLGNGEMREMPEGMEIPEGGFGGNMKGGRGGSSTIEKNGETAAYTIPVGMTISGVGGRNSDYSAISAGMVIRLTLNSDGYVVAAEII